MAIWDNAPKNSQAVFEHLRLLAKRMRVESYGEIAEAIGMKEERHIAPISLRGPLGFIRDEICRARGLPWLNALAVNGDKWLPGDSFLPPGVVFDKDEQVLWRAWCWPSFRIRGNQSAWIEFWPRHLPPTPLSNNGMHPTPHHAASHAA